MHAAQLSLVRQHTFRFSEAEREVFAEREIIQTSEWMNQYLVLPEELRGKEEPFRLARVPYIRGVVDAGALPRLRIQYYVAPPQTGKTIGLYGRMLSDLDQNPAPSLLLMGELEGARNVSKDYLQPLIESSAPTRRLIPRNLDNYAARRMRFRNGQRLFVGYATATKHFKTYGSEHVYGDEREDWPKNIGGFGSPTALLKDRGRSFPHTSKAFTVSSVGGEEKIWKDTLECHRYEEFLVVCPDCGLVQRMVFPRIRIPEGERDPDKIETQKLAWYECAGCESRWDDEKRNQAVALGAAGENGGYCAVDLKYTEIDAGRKGIDKGPIDDPFPQPPADAPARDECISLGQRLPGSWHSQDVSLSTVIADFLRANAINDPELKRAALITWTNSHANRPWVDVPQADIQAEQILKLRDERPAGMVPSWALVLVAGVDTQDNGCWYEIRAFSDDWTSALVRYGFLTRGFGEDDLALVARLVSEPYLTAEGEPYLTRFALQDSAGHRTDAVYAACRESGGLIAPAKGKDVLRSPISYSKIDVFPGTGKAIPGGIQLVHHDTTYWKDSLARRLAVAAADPGAWLLHAETDEEYAKQYTAEAKDLKTGKWEQIGSRANHLWDCGVLCLVAYQILINQGTIAALAEERRASAQPQPQQQLPPPPSSVATRIRNPYARRS